MGWKKLSQRRGTNPNTPGIPDFLAIGSELQEEQEELRRQQEAEAKAAQEAKLKAEQEAKLKAEQEERERQAKEKAEQEQAKERFNQMIVEASTDSLDVSKSNGVPEFLGLNLSEKEEKPQLATPRKGNHRRSKKKEHLNRIKERVKGEPSEEAIQEAKELARSLQGEEVSEEIISEKEISSFSGSGPNIKIIPQSVSILACPTQEEAVALIEHIGRVCYQSYDKVDKVSGEKFIRDRLYKDHHDSLIEHISITVEAITNRGIADELVRHR